MVVSSLTSAAIVESASQIVGAANIFNWEQIDQNWQTQIRKGIAPEQPIACLVFPRTTEELAAVMTYAHQHQCPVVPCGSGSKLSWGGVVGKASDRPLLLVSTTRLQQLIDHAVGDLTVTVEAGIKFADLQRLLTQTGQFLAIDPTYPEAATIGGIVATGDTGSLRQHYGSVRDMLLGISFVRADGQIAKAGGRVVKNVAGYDLMKLFTGSYGTLGILTQLTFRVYPLPPASQTIVVTGNLEAIAQLHQTLLRSPLTPTRLDLLSASLIKYLELGYGTGLAIQFQSIAASVQEQIRIVETLGHSLNLAAQIIAHQDEQTLWQRLQDQMTGACTGNTIVCKIGITPSQANVLLRIDRFALPDCYAQIHGATGIGRVFFHLDTVSLHELIQMRELCQAKRGFLTVLDAPIAVKQAIEPWGYAGSSLNLMRQIKHQFDPHHLLSPQRFIGEI